MSLGSIFDRTVLYASLLSREILCPHLRGSICLDNFFHATRSIKMVLEGFFLPSSRDRYSILIAGCKRVSACTASWDTSSLGDILEKMLLRFYDLFNVGMKRGLLLKAWDGGVHAFQDLLNIKISCKCL